MNEQKTSTPKGMKAFEMAIRVNVPLAAKLVLSDLSTGPSTRSRLLRRSTKYGVGREAVEAGITRLVEERLIEARDGMLHMRPIEEWEDDGHFMAALAMRWPA
jgi:hypothetical protein